MPEYKLIYFNGKGRAEITRWIFVYKGIPFVDDRIEKEDWAARRGSIPGGKLPVLMVGESPLPQSAAIARYAAKEAGLVPEDNLAAAYCDALVDTLLEVLKEVFSVFLAPGSDEEKAAKFKEETCPNVVYPILERLTMRLSNKEWFAGPEISWADLMIVQIFTAIKEKEPNIMENYPVVEALVDKVVSIPAIKEWVEKSPETEF